MAPCLVRTVLRPLPPGLVLWAAALVPPASGQVPEARVATVSVEENFRAEPNGTIIARVRPGVELAVARVSGGWAEAELEGWVWSRSLTTTRSEGLDLRVSAPEGENLRAEPQGAVRARLSAGALLDELDRRPGWVRVRRVGWIWLESVRLAEAGRPPPNAGARSVEPEPPPTVEPPTGAGPPASEVPSPRNPPAAPTSAVPITSGVLTVPPVGLVVLDAPGGDTLAVGTPGRDVQVIARRGPWARVRMEGWAWVGVASETAPDTLAPDSTLDPDAVLREPDRYRGYLVRWRLQFVSVERAERVRTDFYEGEPFLLTRPVDGTGIFVYVAVPPERLPGLEDLVPLDRVEIVGRIRTGSSELTGSPILDLVELRRLSGG